MANQTASWKLQEQADWESGFLGFLYRQLLIRPKPIPSSINLKGQVAIITGSNGGLGFESARQLLGLNLSRLIMAVRSQKKGDQAAIKLRHEFPNRQIDVWLLDMDSYDSILAFVARCDFLPRLDLVILNAAVSNSDFVLNQTTKHEKSLQINYLSTALLTILLLPIVKKKNAGSEPGRITLVNSDTAYWAKLEPASTGPILSRFDNPANFSPMSAYSGEKLLQQLFVAKLIEYVKADDVVVNLTNPGLCSGTAISTDLKASSWFARIGDTLGRALIGRSCESGASCYIDTAIVQGKGSHGSYGSDWTIQPYPKLVYTNEGEDLKERLWEETMEELNFAEVSKLVSELQQ